MKAPWNRQTLPDWTVILRTRKIKIFNIFYHLIFKFQCQQLIMSIVFTPKFQLRICLRNSKVTFLERSAPGDFNELSLMVLAFSGAKIRSIWYTFPRFVTFSKVLEFENQNDHISALNIGHLAYICVWDATWWTPQKNGQIVRFWSFFVFLGRTWTWNHARNSKFGFFVE